MATGAAPPATVPDPQALRAGWHPVGFAARVHADPTRVVLLGEPVVIWRDSVGTAHALRDLCVHRGAARSPGRVVGDRLMCPYHGWQYGSDGVCALLQEFERTIFEQDRRVVESQRSERVPFELAAEMHLTFDAVAINYRQAMRDPGLARRALGDD